MRNTSRIALAALFACVMGACDGVQRDADVIVVGAGIAGITAALEASDAGAEVLVVETASVPGGHAVRAGGFALVGTDLQERKGFKDTPDIAYQDLMAWGENADPDWVRSYAANSGREVYDWLTRLGVKFVVVLDTPEDTVPRFHFTRGKAVHAIVPMMRVAHGRKNIHFLMNHAAESLISTEGQVTGVRIHDTRSGAERILQAHAVVLATGGFQSNLDKVRANWPTGGPTHGPKVGSAPGDLLIGSGHFATGSGIDLGVAAGAALHRMDHQVTFVNGLPNPRKPGHGLNAQNPAAIWVNAEGRRFVSEAANSKDYEAAVFTQPRQTHWLIFDADGRRKLRMRDAEWLTPDTMTEEILDNPAVTRKAGSIERLAVDAGIPAGNLLSTIERYNAFVAAGEDLDFQRFGKDHPGSTRAAIAKPPYYALQLFPMTRKSLGGLAIDQDCQVIDVNGKPIGGLYAAGELTGVAGINGSHGGSGTFLGPAVYTGRIAGHNAARSNADDPGSRTDAGLSAPTTAAGPMQDAAQLEVLLRNARTGYWHFEQSHATVLERGDDCTRCHTPEWPTGPATTVQQKLARLDTCTECH